MSNYEQLLEKAFDLLPGLSEEKADFKIPEVDSLVQGNKTIIKNIAQIADVARRDRSEIAKYLTKELAAPVTYDDQKLTILAKIQQNTLNEKMKRYFELYIICKECHKPDTHVQMIDRGYTTIVCEACGAKYTVKNS
jgi:translation initiation factor 2 subunit 2